MLLLKDREYCTIEIVEQIPLMLKLNGEMKLSS